MEYMYYPKNYGVNASYIARFLFVFLLISPLDISNSFADPWVNTGNVRVRHHLQNLIDRKKINIPATTWPVMWVDIKNALEELDPLQLSPNELWSYKLLKHEWRRQTQKFVVNKQLYAANNDSALSDFSTPERENLGISAGLSFTGDKTSYRVQANYVNNPVDGHENRLDGSYLSGLFGNWSVSIGAIDRWWGPGWQSSLILSNNARPVPAVFVQRNRAEAFDLPLLKYLGPWQLTTFMGQLESNRNDFESPLLWGLRASFRPWRSLEIGVSRTAQWGGEGRPQDLDTFFNLVVGRDNLGDDGINEQNEPGNQLAGFDARWSGALRNNAYALYGQIIGEDEANGTPSRYIGLAGIEFSGASRSVHWRTYVESQNSTASFYPKPEIYNYAYEHGIYSDGYRYRLKALGASTDNDSQSVTWGNQLYFRNGQYTSINFSYFNLNYDGQSKSNVTRAYGSEKTVTNRIQVSHFTPISERFGVTISGYYFSDDLSYYDQTINLGGYVQIEGRW